MKRAEEGLIELKKCVDTLIVIPNQRLLSIVSKDTRLNKAFQMADEVLFNATKGISDLISIPGLINLDFADVKTVMSEMGDALMGSAVATGEDRAVEAAKKAISSPLLEDVTIAGALGLLVNITGGDDITLSEVDAATKIIQEAAGEEANVIFGAVIDEEFKDQIRVTVIATGFNKKPNSTKSPFMKRKMDFRHSTIDYLDVPTYQRKEESEDNQEKEMIESGNGNGNGHDPELELQDEIQTEFKPDEYELPTFLRRRMEL